MPVLIVQDFMMPLGCMAERTITIGTGTTQNRFSLVTTLILAST
jgi:hypothetical protein